MQERDYIILKKLYEEKSITKAAETLYISQPALTYRLQQLEKMFDTKIVLRGKKGINFTVQGEYLVQYANSMLLQLRKTKEIIQNMNNKVQGILRLCVSSNYARYELPSILKAFMDEYPEVEINLNTGWSTDVIHHVLREDVHIGIIRGDHSWQEQSYLIKEEPLCIVSKKRIDLANLPSLPRINYKTDPSLKMLVDQWWKSNFQIPPFIPMEVDRIETCKEMVLNGLGYGIFPKISLTEDDNLHVIEITDNNKNLITRKTRMIYRNSALELSNNRAFIDFIKIFNTL